jgi:hypothetical protein
MADNPSLDNNDDLADIEAMLRGLDLDDLELIEPPTEVWAGIVHSLAAEATPPATTTGATNVVPLAGRRRNRFLASALGIAAAAVLAVAGVAVFNARGGSETDLLASAELTYDAANFDPLGAGASATAELVERDGEFEIVLSNSSLPSELSETADLELWLIEADADGNLVDIAPIALVGGEGTYRVPSSVDVATHRIVDISVEPRDGDEAHSGRSILRGSLQQA